MANVNVMVFTAKKSNGCNHVDALISFMSKPCFLASSIK